MAINYDDMDVFYLPSELQYFKRWIMSDNIAEELDRSILDEIGQKVVRGYELDKESRSEWERAIEGAMKIAQQMKEEKNFPWPNAANVKYPLITEACIQFAARAYPELIQGYETVRCQVIGEDPTGEKEEKASRVSKHMSWQLLDQMEEWEDDADRLLHVLPVMGLCYKKTYYSAVKKRPCSEFLLPDVVVVHYNAKCLDTARRVTQECEFYHNDIYERIETGLWLDVMDELPARPATEGFVNDEEAPLEFLEQHRWFDLDGDGYEEPYVVTVHKDTARVVRIVARYDADGVEVRGVRVVKIKPIQYFTKFPFIPNPDGSFYDLGFGLLLNPLNEAVNTVINQLLDAGTLANTGGGFLARGIRMRSGSLTFQPGEWKPIDTPAGDLRAGIVPLPINQPSTVLFQLLGMLVEAAKTITSVKDVLTGEQPGQNVPATTVLALIEQGLKVFSAIYKRIYRSFTRELKKVFIINSMTLTEDEYFRVLDSPFAVLREDYDPQALDVRPTADPSISSDAQRLAKAQALMPFKGDPGVNQDEINARYMEAIRIPNMERLLVPADQQQPQVDPKVVEAQNFMVVEMEKIELKKMELQAMFAELEIKRLQAEGERMRHEAQAMELYSRAQKYGEENEIQMYKAQVEQMKAELKAQSDAVKNQIDLLKVEVQRVAAQKKVNEGNNEQG